MALEQFEKYLRLKEQAEAEAEKLTNKLNDQMAGTESPARLDPCSEENYEALKRAILEVKIAYEKEKNKSDGYT